MKAAEMLHFALLVLYIFPTFGFLLNTNGGVNPGVQSKEEYLKAADYFDDQATHQRQMDRKLSILSAQLINKFSELERKIGMIEGQNQTSTIETLEQKYEFLEDKYQKLQKNFAILQAQNIAHQQDLLSLKYKTTELEKLKVQCALQNQELISLKNISIENKQHLLNLESLKNLKPILDLQTLQQQVQVLGTTAHSLSVNERARNQDFLALYNETVIVKGTLNNIAVNTNDRFIRIEKDQNVTGNEIQEFILRQNKTNSLRGQEIATNSEKVALTSCSNSETYTTGDVMKFNSIKTTIGISNTTNYKSSGKFTCEKEGLYLISVSIMSSTNGAQCNIYKNGQAIGWTYTSNDEHQHTGTGVAAANLVVNDTLWVKATNSFSVTSDWSCLTIMKIKQLCSFTILK